MKKIIILLILIFLVGCQQELDEFNNEEDYAHCSILCAEQMNLTCMTSYYKEGIVYCYCDKVITYYRENKTEVFGLV